LLALLARLARGDADHAAGDERNRRVDLAVREDGQPRDVTERDGGDTASDVGGDDEEGGLRPASRPPGGGLDAAGEARERLRVGAAAALAEEVLGARVEDHRAELAAVAGVADGDGAGEALADELGELAGVLLLVGVVGERLEDGADVAD